jgi:hypothetical protein
VPTDPLKITGEDLAIIQETLRTGDLNIFTSRCVWMGLLCAGAMVAIGFVLWGWRRSRASYLAHYAQELSACRPKGRMMEGPTDCPAQVVAKS